jgi:outer membrane protein TolC
MTHLQKFIAIFSVLSACTLNVFADSPTPPPKTLTLEHCLELALQQNTDILKARQELRRSHGIIVEARAAALPQLTATGAYRRIDDDIIDVFPGSPLGPTVNQQEPWSAQIEVSQLVYSGGRVSAALRAAKLTSKIAVHSFESIVADKILEVRKAFYRVLLSQSLISVREQSIALLERQLADTKHRFDVGAVPQFNVLRAEVELANARPPLIRAQNALRLSRESLVKLLALDSDGSDGEFTSIEFTGQLAQTISSHKLSDSLALALARRPELKQAQLQVQLARENVTATAAGYKPELAVFANYEIRNSLFGVDVGDDIHGWTIGARASWNIFDGMLTKGKMEQARSQQAQYELTAADIRRSVELEVRQAYSDYIQALELIEASQKTVSQAEESLRLAEARFRAGAGTQLDVLSAQTALTEAASNKVIALHDYNIALATLERAIGLRVQPVTP